MKATAYISQGQMDRFRAITRPCSEELIAPNFRPVQGNVNAVYDCSDDDSVKVKKVVKVGNKRIKVEVEIDIESVDDD